MESPDNPDIRLPNNQGHAEDLLLMMSYRRFIIGQGAAFSELQYEGYWRALVARWPVNFLTASRWRRMVAEDYPLYIREARRPNELERGERDAAIARRWMESF